eukprot:6492570-Amphidinium_carterae.3
MLQPEQITYLPTGNVDREGKPEAHKTYWIRNGFKYDPLLEFRVFYDRLKFATPLYKWIKKLSPEWMFFLAECGVDMNSDLVLSHKAAETRKKLDGGNYRCLPEFAVSIRLLLALLLCWGGMGRNGADIQHGKELLQEFLQHLPVGSVEGFLIRLKAFSFPALIGQCGLKASPHVCGHVLAMAGQCVSMSTPAETVMSVLLFAMSMRNKCVVCLSFFKRVLDDIVELMRQGLEHLLQKEVQLASEEVAPPRGSKRRRRVDPQLLNMAGPEFVGPGKRFRTAQRALKASGGFHDSAGFAMEEQYMRRYLRSTREHFASKKQVHIAMDAARIGGSNRLFSVCMSREGSAAWMVPQVFSGEQVPDIKK